MSNTERRPRYFRSCPVPDCEWRQVTAWFVGGPDVTEEIPDHVLKIEAFDHMQSHYGPVRQWYT